MKTVFPILLLLAISVACNNKVEEARKEVLQLEKYLMAVTDSVNDWVARLDNQLLSWEEMYADMSLLTLEEVNLDNAAYVRIDSLNVACEGHGEVYSKLKEDAEFHLIDCIDAAEVVSRLKSRLGTDTVNLELAVGQMEKIRSETEAHESEFARWEEALNTTRTACLKTCAEYAKLTSGEEEESLY